MYACMYVCIYVVCMHVCMYVCMYVCMLCVLMCVPFLDVVSNQIFELELHEVEWVEVIVEVAVGCLG